MKGNVMKSVAGVTTGLAVTLLCAHGVWADGESQTTTNYNPGLEISIGTEYMTGDTTYDIGYPVSVAGGGTQEGYFPFSELEWPLDFTMIRADAGLELGPSVRIDGTVKKSVTDPDDTMIDRDWVTDANPGRLDIYSESDVTDFDAVIYELDVKWNFLKRQNLDVFAGLGYQYQKFEYDARMINQYSPSGMPGFDYQGDGRIAISYEMTYKIPYLLVGGNFEVAPNFSLSGSFGYSPVVDATDVDQHLLRDKVSKGDMDGDAFMLDVEGRYDFNSLWFVKGGLQYMKIDVDGDQQQSFSGQHFYTVSQEADSSQFSSFISCGVKF